MGGSESRTVTVEGDENNTVTVSRATEKRGLSLKPEYHYGATKYRTGQWILWTHGLYKRSTVAFAHSLVKVHYYSYP